MHLFLLPWKKPNKKKPNSCTQPLCLLAEIAEKYVFQYSCCPLVAASRTYANIIWIKELQLLLHHPIRSNTCQKMKIHNENRKKIHSRPFFFRTQSQTLHWVFLQIKICSQWCRRAVISIRHLVIPNGNYQLNSPHLTEMNNCSSSIVEKFKMSNWV